MSSHPYPSQTDTASASVAGSAPTAGAGSTKQRLLDAAEQLFALHGLEGISIRAVTQAAGTSVSAANYHFGSKEELLRATLTRRIAALNRRRLERLDALASRPGNPRLEDVVDAFLRPHFEVRAERVAAGEPVDHVGRFAARLYAERPLVLDSLKRDLIDPLHARFVDAIARALPGSRPEEAELAVELTLGVMVHAISSRDAAGALATEGGATPPYETLLRRMTRFAAAGIRSLVGESEPQSQVQSESQSQSKSRSKSDGMIAAESAGGRGPC